MDVTLKADGRGARAETRCRELSRAPYSEEADKLTRRFLTPEHRATIDRISVWMREAGMEPRVDAAGSLVARWEGVTFPKDLEPVPTMAPPS